MLVECELARIMITETSGQQIVVLREIDGGRNFPIVIGIFEALSIDREVKGVRPERPMTHDLLKSVIEEMGGTLERIVVSDLRGNTFYAYLEVALNGGKLEIDSRPSDALCLAVRCGAKVFVEDKVFDLAVPPGPA